MTEAAECDRTARDDRARLVQRALAVYLKHLPESEYVVLDAWVRNHFAFQQAWMLDPNRFAICIKSRQIGISHATAGWAVLRGAMHGETTTVISTDQRAAEEVLDKAGRHASVLVAGGSRWALSVARSGELRFPFSGGRILALPASSGGRGFSGNVVLDELAYHGPRSEEIWDAASAVVMHGYALRAISTPNGTGNLFHELATNPAATRGWSRHQISIDDARTDGMRVNDAELWAMAHGDPRVFAQLFRCSFLDGAEQYLPSAAIHAAITDPMPEVEGECYGGLDVGLVNDLSTLTTIVQDARGECWEKETLCWKRTDWETQQREIEAAYKRWGWRRLCVDATGLGAVPAQLLQKKLGRQRVEPVHFTSGTKEDLATTLYQAFSDGMVHIRRDPEVVQDLSSIKRIVTSTGAVRYDADRTSRGHADRAWSLALALMACSNKPGRRIERGDTGWG